MSYSLINHHIYFIIGRYESEHIKKIVNNIFMGLNCRMIDVGPNLVCVDSHVNEII